MAKNYRQMLEQIEKLKVQAEALRSKEVSGVVSRIKEAITHYGLTADDLFGHTADARVLKSTAVGARPGSRGGRSRSAGMPKFSDGSGRTWTGVGKRPQWFVDALTSGKSADELLIDKSAVGEEPSVRSGSGKGAGKSVSHGTSQRVGKRAPKRPRKGAGVPKYRSAEGQTWTGFGKRPAWFVQAIEAGQQPDDLLIK